MVHRDDDGGWQRGVMMWLMWLMMWLRLPWLLMQAMLLLWGWAVGMCCWMLLLSEDDVAACLLLMSRL